MVRVGLTGGIGSGKSTVTALLSELGALIIDADQLAREVVEPASGGLVEIVDQFGTGILTPAGKLDREAMARLVFGDADARTRLEAIVHPRVRARASEREAAAAAGQLVVHDIPLLVETGRSGEFDTVVVVDAPTEVRLDRLTRLRGMPADEARSRIEAQASREARLAVADHVIVNEGSPDQLRTAVRRLWSELVRGETGRD